MDKKNDLLNPDSVSLFIYLHNLSKDTERLDSPGEESVLKMAVEVANNGQKAN